MRLAPGARLVIATHNAGKLTEMADLLRPFGLDCTSAGALGLPEPAETGTTLPENAAIKAVAAARAAGLPALADDSGFFVAALDGAPGVHTADWAARPDGTRDFAAAMDTVHRACGDHADPRAWFGCALCLAAPDGTTTTFVGRVDGTRIWPPRGDRGFGFDPMFVPAGASLTFAEMTPQAKHAISHRALAFRAFAAACLG